MEVKGQLYMKGWNQSRIFARKKQINVEYFGVNRLYTASDIYRVLNGDLPFYSRREVCGNSGR